MSIYHFEAKDMKSDVIGFILGSIILFYTCEGGIFRKNSCENVIFTIFGIFLCKKDIVGNQQHNITP